MAETEQRDGTRSVSSDLARPHEDWHRGRRVDDWQARHLRRPPRKYEWREADGQYVLANPVGVIFQVVVPH